MKFNSQRMSFLSIRGGFSMKHFIILTFTLATMAISFMFGLMYSDVIWAAEGVEVTPITKDEEDCGLAGGTYEGSGDNWSCKFDSGVTIECKGETCTENK